MSISQNFPDQFPNLRLNFAQGKTLDPRVSFSRSSTATYVDPNGLIQTAGVNTPRFNYDPITGECKGLLMEESRTNYIQSSQNFTSAFWNSSNNVTIVPNSINSPAGNLTASLLIPSTAAAPSVAWSTLAVSSAPYTVSCYVKPKGFSWCFLYDAQGNKKAYFNLTGSGSVGNIDAGITSASISSLPNGWYRVIVTSTVTYLNYAVGACNANGSTSATGDGVSGIYIWGAQLEQGSFPTSYIPSSSSTVTRSADVAQITTTNLNNFYNSSGGTLLTTATPLSPTQNRTNLVTIGSATTNYPALISLLPGANGAQFRSTNSTIPQADFAAVGSGTTRTIVCANFANNNFTFNTNSNGLGTTSSGTIGTATTLTIGGTGLGTTETFNGTIENILYYPTPISNSQVTALSSASGSVQLGNNQFAFTVRILSGGTTYTLLTNNSGTYNYNVSWGDGSVTNGITTNNPTHTYSNAGVYTVIVTLNTGSFYFYNNSNSTNGPLVTGVVGNGSSFLFTSTNLYGAWWGCSNLTSFPQLNASNVTGLQNAWYNCSSLTSFPLINTSNGTNFIQTWYNCSSLTSFPLIDTSKGTSFNSAWLNCSALTSFPTLNFSNGTDFSATWQSCSGFTSFPVVSFPKATSLSVAWYGCSNLTTFPSITFGGAGATNPVFNTTWYLCSKLSSFPAGAFNACTGSTNYTQAWTSCALTATSIENILTSIVSSGATINTPSPGNIGLNGGTNASKSTWTTNANNAYNTLVGAGWTISYNP